jgi:ribosomal protein S27E
MSKPTREEIQARRDSCDASELEVHREYARRMLQIRTCRAYYEAECDHAETFSVFQISHHEVRCKFCGKQLKAKELPCNPSSPS